MLYPVHISKVPSKPDREPNRSPRNAMRVRRLCVSIRNMPKSIPSQHRGNDPEPVPVVPQISGVHAFDQSREFVYVHHACIISLLLLLLLRFSSRFVETSWGCWPRRSACGPFVLASLAALPAARACGSARYPPGASGLPRACSRRGISPSGGFRTRTHRRRGGRAHSRSRAVRGPWRFRWCTLRMRWCRCGPRRRARGLCSRHRLSLSGRWSGWTRLSGRRF